MNILDGLRNFLNFVNDHWAETVVIAGLAAIAIWRVVSWLNMSDEDKIAIAKKQLKEIMLKLVTNAEKDYNAWVKAGAVKRSEVIDMIFQKFPILNRVADQETLIAEIDNLIDAALVEMRKILSENQDKLA